MRRRPAALIAASAFVVSMSVTGAAPATLTDDLDQIPFAETDRSAGAEGVSARETRQALDEAAQALVDDGAVGITARVESPEFTWRGAAGTRELDGAAPARAHDQFRVGSITKTMVATLVMQEVEAGTLRLDTPVDDIVPGLFPDHPDITVEQLLSHRSGAQTGTDALLLSQMEDPTDWEQFIDAVGLDYTEEDHLATVNGLPWLFEPGSDFGYSNAGYIALGVVLEELTGEDLEDLLQDRVFDEAGMYVSSYPEDPGVEGPFLMEAMFTGTADVGGIGWASLDGFDPDVFGAAGAVVSSTRDLNRFTEALLGGDLVDADVVAEMLEPRSSTLVDYGLGIYRVPDPCTDPGQAPQWLYGHAGATYGTQSIALTSADGSRQVSLGATGRDLSGAQPLYDIDALLGPMLLSTCGD